MDVLPAFLAAGSFPNAVDSAADLEHIDDVTPIADLRADETGNGQLAFEVPELPSGEYQVILYCESCPLFSAGSNVIAVAPFRVTGTTPANDSRTPLTLAIIVLVLLAVAIGARFIVRRPKIE